ncbi:MAG TPA: DNA repair protein RadC [Polyangiales bacterium]|nr:DNA repair protein RadC [Polyangiales bacterium]
MDDTPNDEASMVRSGPRERLQMYGARALSDAELVAVVLGTGTCAEPVSVLAARVLQRAGGLLALTELDLGELQNQTGVGPTKACRLHAAIELGRRANSMPLSRGRPISTSREVDAALRPRLRGNTREHFYAVPLDAKNRPLAELEIAVGGLMACAITPSDVFRPLMRHAAASVILAHNHPSGEPSPSDQDVVITQRLCRAGELLGVHVLDHLVIGESGYFSFLDAGMLQAR